MKLLIISFLSFFVFNIKALVTGLPIIDMHQHAQEVICMDKLPISPNPDAPQSQLRNPSGLLPRTVEEMNKFHIVIEQINKN